MEYVNFVVKTGLIDCDETLKSIGAPEGYECGAWSADRFSAKALIEFCEKNPTYHILTSVESEDDDFYDVIVNRYALVNRLTYYLGNGSKDEELTYTEKR
jgi:hypothetical protein